MVLYMRLGMMVREMTARISKRVRRAERAGEVVMRGGSSVRVMVG
jgi:hypothetical protein